MEPIREGVFISLTPSEAETVWAMVKEDGFEPTKDGLKEFLLHIATSDSEPIQDEEKNSFDTLLKTGADYFKKNPEQFDLIKKLGPHLGSLALKKIFKI